MRIYKILPRRDWEAARAAGVYQGSELDRSDGFIHFSSADQAQETARRHFHGQAVGVLRIEAVQRPRGEPVQAHDRGPIRGTPSGSSGASATPRTRSVGRGP